MRQIREVLRLKHACGQNDRQIAATVRISRYTVAEYLRRAAVVGIRRPLPPRGDDQPTTAGRKLAAALVKPLRALQHRAVWLLLRGGSSIPG